jgi:hypothetical protein
MAKHDVTKTNLAAEKVLAVGIHEQRGVQARDGSHASTEKNLVKLVRDKSPRWGCNTPPRNESE